MRYQAVCCIFLWLLLPRTLAQPAVIAPVPVPVPINTQWIGSDGSTYTLSGTLSLTVSAPAPPPPPPPPPSVTLGYLSMVPGTVTAGQSARVDVVLSGAVPAGQTANVLLSSADAGVQVPSLLSIPAGKSGGSAVVITTIGVKAEKLVAVTGSYNGKSGYANLRIEPDQVLPAAIGGPTISGYLNGDGTPVTTLIYGQEVRILGQAFGPTPGSVTWNGGAIPILAWSDSDVRVRLPLPRINGGAEFTLTRPDGQFHDLLLPLDLPARVPGNTRRR